MATGVSGNFEITGNNGIAMHIYYSESYEVSTNVSAISITDIQVKSSDWYGITYYLNGAITIDGSAVVTMDSNTGTHSVSISAKNTYTSVSGSRGAASVTHNADGSKSITISVFVRGYTQSGGAGSGWTVEGSKSIALTTIPRASTISATDANIGSVSMIAINKKNLSYSHSVAYHFGNLHGFLTPDGGTSPSLVIFTPTSIPFRIPEEFYSQIPNSVTGICKLVCSTYLMQEKVGSSQETQFTVTASLDTSGPVVSGTVVDINDTTIALTGDNNKLVRYCSTALCTIDATAKNSASIVRKLINGEQVSGDTRSIWGVETGDFTFYAQDSRGYSGGANVRCEIVPYVVLTNNASVYRPSPTTGEAVINVKGNFFNSSFGAVQNTLEVKYRIRGGNWAATTPKISESSFTASVKLEGMDYNESFDIEVSVSDKIGSITQQIILGKGIPVFDWGEDDFCFNKPVQMNQQKVLGLPTPTASDEAANKSYVDNALKPAYYTAMGHLFRSDGGTISGVGVATVIVYPDGLAQIHFSITINSAGSNGECFDYGIDAELLRARNPDIPMISPLIGGYVDWYDHPAMQYTDEKAIFGAFFAPAKGRYWRVARILNDGGSWGDYPETAFGQWERIVGTCFGRVIS